jgi:hypothetical protein
VIKRERYQESEVLKYQIFKGSEIIKCGELEFNDMPVCLPWVIQKTLPPNVVCIFTRPSTGETKEMEYKLNLDIHTPKFNKPRGNYRIDVSWDYVDFHLKSFMERNNQTIDEILNPEFQRGHVWNEEQQIKYIEYIVMGGNSGKDVYFNCSSWNNSSGDNNVFCIDGLQRITAVRRFMNNEIAIFDNIYEKDTSGINSSDHSFSWHVLDFQNYNEILDWYIDMNDAGTYHTKEELDRVRGLKK